jgi:hypothetical protein
MNRISTSFLLVMAITLLGCVKEEDQQTSSRQTAPIGGGSASTSNLFFCNTRDLNRDSSTQLSTLFSDYNKMAVNKATSSPANGFTIPVRFHVIQGGSSTESEQVPDDALVEQIDILNRAYAGETGGVPTPYRFRLASINRVANKKWSSLSPGSPEEAEAKKALRVGDATTLNVFISNIVAPEGQKGTILGYSTFPFVYKLQPEIDGIVLNYRAVPGSDLANFNTGHVLVHETGHWLGLLHTFTGACDGAFTDLVFDTPREKPPTPGNYCPVGRDSCPETSGTDPIHNHMTYTGDSCRTEFTQGQVNFMRFNTLLFRGMV